MPGLTILCLHECPGGLQACCSQHPHSAERRCASSPWGRPARLVCGELRRALAVVAAAEAGVSTRCSQTQGCYDPEAEHSSGLTLLTPAPRPLRTPEFLIDTVKPWARPLLLLEVLLPPRPVRAAPRSRPRPPPPPPLPLVLFFSICQAPSSCQPCLSCRIVGLARPCSLRAQATYQVVQAHAEGVVLCHDARPGVRCLGLRALGALRSSTISDDSDSVGLSPSPTEYGVQSALLTADYHLDKLTPHLSYCFCGNLLNVKRPSELQAKELGMKVPAALRDIPREICPSPTPPAARPGRDHGLAYAYAAIACTTSRPRDPASIQQAGLTGLA